MSMKEYFTMVFAWVVAFFVVWIVIAAMSEGGRINRIAKVLWQLFTSILGFAFLGFLVVGLAKVGCDSWREWSTLATFDQSARKLNTLLNSVGNRDLEVIAACTAVEDAFQDVDLSKVAATKSVKMKLVVINAALWRSDLLVYALASSPPALAEAQANFRELRRSLDDYLRDK